MKKLATTLSAALLFAIPATTPQEIAPRADMDMLRVAEATCRFVSDQQIASARICYYDCKGDLKTVKISVSQTCPKSISK